jgi:Major capsid protein N-terminus/Large eukaryotic DNA virus major capsid protein
MTFNGKLNNSNITAGYMDLATAWKMEGEYLYAATPISSQYNHPCGISYFVREIKRATWFTQIPVALRTGNGIAAFGQEFSSNVVRVGEYLLNTYLAVELPEVTLLASNQFGVNGRLRWCRKIMHNLIEDCDISFNEQKVARIDNYILDMITQFTNANKQDGYDEMIGDTIDLTGSHGPTTPLSATIPSKKLILNLPFFYFLDSGFALPTAALLFNEIKINYKLRDWDKLLILDNSGVTGAGTVARAVPLVNIDIYTAPVLKNVSTWAHYALVSDFERQNMAQTSRDMIIEQYQTAARMPFLPITNPSVIYEPKFTFSVKALYFAIRNKTFANEWSNYTTSSPYNSGSSINFLPPGITAPISTLSLNYESTTRLSEMDWNYFSLVNPYYCCPTMGREIGYGIYSYALKMDRLDPNGSTNFSKIGNVQIAPTPSTIAITGAGGAGAAGSGMDFAQIYEWNNIACSYTVIRISDGQLTFPFV